jgi:hypothetical protein
MDKLVNDIQKRFRRFTVIGIIDDISNYLDLNKDIDNDNDTIIVLSNDNENKKYFELSGYSYYLYMIMYKKTAIFVKDNDPKFYSSSLAKLLFARNYNKCQNCHNDCVITGTACPKCHTYICTDCIQKFIIGYLENNNLNIECCHKKCTNHFSIPKTVLYYRRATV